MKNRVREAGEAVFYNYSAVFISQLLSMPISIFYLSLVTRWLGPQNFGYLTIFMAAAQFFISIFINWTRNSIIRFGSEEFIRDGTLKSMLAPQFIITFGSLLIALIVIPFTRLYLNSVLHLGPNSYLWISAYLIVYVLADFINQFLRVRHLVRAYAASLLLRQLVLLILLISAFAAINAKGVNVLDIILIELVSYLLISLVFFFIAFPRKYLLFSLGHIVARIKAIFNYSWPILISVWLGYFILWADLWIIRYFLSFSAVGEYDAANRLIQQITNALIPLCVIGGPLVVSLKSAGKENIVRLFAQRIVPQVCFLWSLFIFTLLVFSTAIILLLFGETFSASVWVFKVLIIGLSFQVLPYLYTVILEAYDLTKNMALVASICFIVNIFLNLLLIPRIGIVGAAAAKFAVALISASMYAHYGRKSLGVRGGHGIVYCFLGFPTVILMVQYLISNPFISLAVSLFLMAAVIIAVKKSSLFSQEELLFWEKIKMPMPIRRIFKKFYSILT